MPGRILLTRCRTKKKHSDWDSFLHCLLACELLEFRVTLKKRSFQQVRSFVPSFLFRSFPPSFFSICLRNVTGRRRLLFFHFPFFHLDAFFRLCVCRGRRVSSLSSTYVFRSIRRHDFRTSTYECCAVLWALSSGRKD